MTHPLPVKRFIHIYCDESRQTADRYMVLGGIIALRENEDVFRKAMLLFRQSNNMHAELGFYKLMYQFLLHRFGAYLVPSDQCIIFLDQRTTSRYKLSTLCAILNNGLNKKYGLSHKPVRSIQAMDSRDSDFIQVADVLMGAIGYEMNAAHTRTHAKRAKVALAEYIAKKTGLLNLQQPTPRSLHHFSIWHFHFRNPAQK